MKIGVLALQGAFREHREVLTRLDVPTKEIRKPEDLAGCDGLILPGGETTTQRKLAQAYGLWEPIGEMGRKGMPILATCAGLILLAEKINGQAGLSLNLLEIEVARNAYGRQVFSFEAPVDVSFFGNHLNGNTSFRAIFIRAPRIVGVGPKATVLSEYGEDPVVVKQGNILGLCFHPELTPDDRFHRYFLETMPTKNVSRPGG